MQGKVLLIQVPLPCHCGDSNKSRAEVDSLFCLISSQLLSQKYAYSQIKKKNHIFQFRDLLIFLLPVFDYMLIHCLLVFTVAYLMNVKRSYWFFCLYLVHLLQMFL